MNLPNGHLLQNGKYRLTHVVGQGGFGITYKGVWHTEVKGSLGTVKTDVPIAIKEYFFKDYCYREDDSFAVKVHSETGKNIFDKFKEKLIREARILSDVHHPNIVNVLEVFEENNTAYIAMEYISGLSLKEMMEREGALPEGKVLKYVHQIGEALQFVHDNNILHLDIKPSNILIDRRDNARLIDFGVSKRYDAQQQETSTTMLTLSKGFASIEQYDNEGTQSFSPYPDVYSLGASMYNLLTGKIPTESILRATRPLAKPTELNPEITPKTEGVIIKAMEVVPSDRYQTVKEMMDALDPAPEEEIKEEVQTGEYFRFITNEGGETTVIFSGGNSKTSVGEDAEETLLNDRVDTLEQPKKKNKRLYLTLFLILFALVASAITFVYYNKQGSTVGKEVTGIAETNPKENKTQSDGSQEPLTREPVQQEADNTTEEVTNTQRPETTQPSSTVVNEPIITNREETTTVNNPTLTTEQPIQLGRDEWEATFDSLFASGREKSHREQYDAALIDFRKAKEISPRTDDMLSMIIMETENKAKEKDIIDRRAQYEEKMAFGRLIIVRRKASPELYGAIDAEANEVIPCKYLFPERAGDEFAFMRDDNLFDIYDSEGQLLREGVDTYNE